MDGQKRQKNIGTDVEKMLYNKGIEGISYTQVHYAGKDIQFLYEMMEKVLIMKSRFFNPKLVKTLDIHFEISSFWDAVHMESNFSQYGTTWIALPLHVKSWGGFYVAINCLNLATFFSRSTNHHKKYSVSKNKIKLWQTGKRWTDKNGKHFTGTDVEKML